MTDDRKSFLMRISGQLFDELKRWADDDMRSVNGQIEFILREAVRQRRKHLGPVEPPADEPTNREE
ncbi:MAG TPA: PTS ascorbate transporter subunit IIC [Pirellulaceae bacterium]|nr:PTS ascorbate transporter subunit IIC [Pirellulaceae bacterium]